MSIDNSGPGELFINGLNKTINKLHLDGRISHQRLTNIRVLAYCLLDNHYHLVIQNVSGRMSDFFKQMNSYS